MREHAVPAGPVAVGPFELERPIGRGGMAEVWLGVHRAQQHKVAVKILTGERAREDAFIRALRNEIHNVARLHHPGIILLFDTGEVDEEAERTTAGRFVAGSPWFAMELASHGSLSPRRLPLPWSTTRMLLLSLLDALAHAHARGVIHRDLKPGNILLCAPDDPRPGLKLTDFGIAQPIGEHIDGEAEQGRLSGTPRYMAPEQFQARWRDFGPWTDLYALGCIAYQLATGKAPFSGDALRLAIAHCHDPPEPPSAHMKNKSLADGYPDGYDAWVLRLLEKEPGRRFACAADAAWALLPLSVPGAEEENTVTAGWEEALRSLKPLTVEPSDMSGAPTVLRTSLTGEIVDGSAQDPHEEMSQSVISAAIARTEQTNVNTVLDRKTSPAAKRPDATDHAKPQQGRFASMSSENESTAGVTRDLPPEMVSDDDLFPKIAPEKPRRRRGTKVVPPPVPESTLSGPTTPVTHGTRAPAPDPVGVDTTFAANVPWTELQAMAPAESMPTRTGRAPDVAGRRKADTVDESLLAPRAPPPMPPTWRRPGPQAPVRHLLGAGQGLYGLRQIPLVDRDGERDLLWDTLRTVHDGTGARAIVLRGPAGIGKSRLAEWLVERAAEVGAAVALRAGHGPGGGPLDGLAGLVAIHARTIGLSRRGLQRRLIEVVRRQGIGGVEEALALAELLNPARDDFASRRSSGVRPLPPPPSMPPTPSGRPDDDGPGDGIVRDANDATADFSVAQVEASDESERVRLDSARERHSVCLRYLVRVARERPVVAWLDDVQWGGDAIAFARAVLDDELGRLAPILLVLSASEEGLGERPIEAGALDELCRNPRTVQLSLPHLPTRDHRALVEELLGLEQGLAGAVAARSAGNPLFAVQLVGDFVQRGVLEITPDGFALKKGEPAALPDNLHEVWSERVRRVFAKTPPDSQRALELGAVLGSNGDDGEWQAMCETAGVDLPAELVDELLRARLVVPDDAGLRFAHAMLRESVLRVAEEGGRLESHHRTAAKMLRKRYGDRRRGVAERIGRHLVSAGDVEEALPWLLRAAEEAAVSAGYPQAHMLLAERDAAIDALGLPEEDARRAEGWALKASFLVDEGKLDEARMWAGLVLRYAGEDEHAPLIPGASRVCAQCALQQARWDEAERHFTHARDAAVAVNDVDMIVRSTVGLADIAYYRGHLDESAGLLAQALALCQEEGDEGGMAYCLWNLAYVSIWRGDADEARELLLRQQKLARRTGHRSMIANGKNALGDLERFSGHYDDADARYDDALRLLEAIGSGKRRTVRLNMAMNAVARGNLARARALADDLLAAAPRLDPGIASLCHGVLAACAAHDRNWKSFDEHIAVLAASKPERDLVDADGAMLFEIIGDHARAQEDDARAADAYEHALELWSVLGRKDRVSGVQNALGKLGTVRTLRRRGH